VKTLKKCFSRVGVRLNELVVNPLATAEVVLDKKQKELGVLLVNLGNTTTNIAVFEEGKILSVKIIPYASRYITTDLAIGLRIPINLAEEIKINYGTALSLKSGKSEKINFDEINQGEKGSTTKRDISKIIRSRCEEIFKLVNEELATIDRQGKLPGGVVLAGAGSKLEGLTEIAKDVFKVPATLASPHGFVSENDKSFDIDFATAVGLVVWGSKRFETNKSGKRFGGGPPFKIGQGVKNLFKNLFSY
jgi:cell division protein FtsA